MTLDATLEPLRRSGYAGQARAAIRALRRDLERLVRVLAEPVTAVRRDALVRHVHYLVARLGDLLPPAAVRVCAQARSGAAAGPLELQGAFAAMQVQARRWQAEPTARAAVLAGARHALATLDRWADGGTEGSELVGMPATGRPATGRAVSGLARRDRVPTRLAYRVFWLLDELDPALAGPLVAELSPAPMWLLRNLFSGGYNRRAHLMWVGGGSGPAV